MPFTFRHKTIRSYRLGKWQFKNNFLTIATDAEREQFLDNLSKFPNRITKDIVELNAEAMRNLESNPLKGRAIRGVQGTAQIPSPAKGSGASRPTAPQGPAMAPVENPDVSLPGVTEAELQGKETEPGKGLFELLDKQGS